MPESSRRPFPATHPASQSSSTTNARHTPSTMPNNVPQFPTTPFTPYLPCVPLPVVNSPAYITVPLSHGEPSNKGHHIANHDQHNHNILPQPPIIVASALGTSKILGVSASPKASASSTTLLSPSDTFAVKPSSSPRHTSHHPGTDKHGSSRALKSSTIDAPVVPNAHPSNPYESYASFQLFPPLLARDFPDVVEVHWDVSCPETDAQLCDAHGRRQQIIEKIWSLPATAPPIERMELILQPRGNFFEEWKHVEVTASSNNCPVTVRDVLRAIYQTLQIPLTRVEVACLQSMVPHRVVPMRKVARINCMEAFMFGGLERPLNGRGDAWLVTFQMNA